MALDVKNAEVERLAARNPERQSQAATGAVSRGLVRYPFARSVLVGCFLLSVVVSGFSPTARAQSKSVWSGVYTTQQADAGEKIYFARCSTCHGDDLGGREQAPAVAGSQFLDVWHGRDVRRLLDRILTMPPADKPVTNAEAIDLLAFLLRASEVPSGTTALPAERTQLVEIMIERAKP